MRCLSLAIGGVILAHTFLWPQQPSTIPSDDVRFDRGTIKNGTYSNSCFGLSFSIPQGWEVSTMPGLESGKALHLPGGGLGLLMIARHREKTFGDQIVMNAKYDGKNSALTVQSLVNATAEAQVSADRQERRMVREAFAVEYAGKQFYRADYKQSFSNGSALFTALVYTKFGEYLIGVTVTASSPEALDDAADSLRALSLQRDSPNPMCVVGPDDGPVMGVIGTIRSSSSRLGTSSRVRVSQLVSEGLLIKRVQPEYPEAARQAHAEGSVVLDVLIDANGDVESATVISGPPLLAPAAIDAVKRWKFRPYTLNGRPAKIETQATVDFQLSPN
jgi:TonB family protein